MRMRRGTPIAIDRAIYSVSSLLMPLDSEPLSPLPPPLTGVVVVTIGVCRLAVGLAPVVLVIACEAIVLVNPTFAVVLAAVSPPKLQ